MSGSGKKAVEVAAKARKTIDWDGMAKFLVTEDAQREFANLLCDEINHSLQTKYSQTRPSNSTAVGVKRNTPLATTARCTAEAAGTELPWLAIPRKKTQTTQGLWICTLCDISCTSRDCLADHRLGKKHRTKISESKGKIGDGGSDKTDAKALATDVNQSAGPNSDTGAVKSSGLQRKSGHKKKVKPTAVGVRQNTTLATTAGCTAEASGTELPWLAIPRKKTNTTQSLWICTLCDISCTSRDGLADHRLGKKHKTKISESKGKIGDSGSNKTDAKALETDINQSAGGSNSDTGAVKSSGLQRKSGHKKKVKPNAVVLAAIKQETKLIKYAFWCKLCGVGCNNNRLQDTHLKGKKHVRLSAMKNSGVDGGAIQSVEIEVKQAGLSDAESTALVPKGENAKEGDTVNEGTFRYVETARSRLAATWKFLLHSVERLTEKRMFWVMSWVLLSSILWIGLVSH